MRVRADLGEHRAAGSLLAGHGEFPARAAARAQAKGGEAVNVIAGIGVLVLLAYGARALLRGGKKDEKCSCQGHGKKDRK